MYKRACTSMIEYKVNLYFVGGLADLLWLNLKSLVQILQWRLFYYAQCRSFVYKK
jgi:hypothetical protein